MRLAVWLAGLLLLVGVGAARGAIQVEVDGDRVTLKAENAPLQEILQTIAGASHFPLYLEAPLTAPITVQFTQRPLVEALEDLLRDQSMLIRYARERGALQVEEVRVLAPSNPSNHKAAARSNSGAIPQAHPGSVVAVSLDAPPSSDASPAGRFEAALTLVAGEQVGAGREILEDLLRTSDEIEVRQQALTVLTSLEPVPLESVAAAVLSDPAPELQLQALAFLGNLAAADSQAREALHQVTSQVQDPDLRQLAQGLLELSGSDQSVTIN